MRLSSEVDFLLFNEVLEVMMLKLGYRKEDLEQMTPAEVWRKFIISEILAEREMGELNG